MMAVWMAPKAQVTAATATNDQNLLEHIYLGHIHVIIVVKIPALTQ